MECTKVNCPMQAGTPTDNCGENCPWRTTAKIDNPISRTAAIEEIKRMPYWHTPDGYCAFTYDDIEAAINNVPTVDAIPVEWLKEHCCKDIGTSDGYIYGRRRITVLEALSMWQKEQEAR